jgi:hypothetical protein
MSGQPRLSAAVLNQFFATGYLEFFVTHVKSISLSSTRLAALKDLGRVK